MTDRDTVIKERSFDHRGRIYDVRAATIDADPHTFHIDVTCNDRRQLRLS